MNYLQQRWALLKRPAFRNFIISCLLATFGSGLSYIAMTWLILRGRHDITAITTLMIAFWLPGVILGPLLGVLVDRYSRKWLIIANNLIRAAILIALGFYLREHFHINLLYALALISGVFFTLYWPASVAMIREIVPKKDLLNANASVDIAYEFGNILGMGAVGLFLAFFSVASTFICNGLFFILAAFFLLRIPHQPKSNTLKKAKQNSYWKEFRDGFQYILQNKPLLMIYLLQLVNLAEYMVAPVLLAPFAHNVLHTSVQQFGYIEAFLSIGVVIGGIIIPWFAQRHFLKTLVWLSVMIALASIAFLYNRNFWFAEGLYLLIGISLASWALVVTKAQDMTALDYQGRVQSVFSSLSGLIVLLVYLSIQFLGHYFSVSNLYWIEVAFAGIGLLLIWRSKGLLRTTPRASTPA